MSQRYLPGETIRNKQTGKCLLIVHVYRVCVFVVDLTEGNMPIPHAILERDYSQWATEDQFDSRENTDNIMEPYPEITYHPISL